MSFVGRLVSGVTVEVCEDGIEFCRWMEGVEFVRFICGTSAVYGTKQTIELGIESLLEMYAM